MGAKFGNIQVLNTSVEELWALLPKAVVGQWSERFVTALSENYAMGTVEREGQKLSRKVAGPVLTVGLFDDDLLGLTVYQGGKRLTEHVLNPYDEINKAGNPAVFCAALGLPAEDEKRLRAVWKKGNATEQLDLTQKLLAAPLWCDENWQPDKRVARDAEMVDRWLNERPEPPKLKNKTKAELIQELERHQVSSNVQWGFVAKSDIFLFNLVDEEGGYCPTEAHERFYDWGSNGFLRDTELHPPVAASDEDWEFHYVAAGNGRVLGLQWTLKSNSTTGNYVAWDSAGALRIPFFFPLKGKNRSAGMVQSMPDGGLLAWLHAETDETRRPPERVASPALVRYQLDGTVTWSRELPEEEITLLNSERIYTYECLPNELKFCFRSYDADGVLRGEQALEWNSRFVGDAPSGELWIEEPTKDGKRLLHLDENLNILAQSTDFPGYGFDLARNPAGDILLATIFNEGIWLLDADTLAVKQELRSKAQVYGPIVDGHGRFWVGSGDSTIEAYDENLQPISRHRLKGGLLVDGRWLDEKGNLCVLTSNMPKGNHVRVYRIT